MGTWLGVTLKKEYPKDPKSFNLKQDEMKIAPIMSDWPVLQAFYQKLAQELHARGVGSLTTGGIACILYNLAQSTKDCDIIIPIEKTQTVIEIISQLTFQGQQSHLTLKYGAPLAEQWLNGGWSSHTYYGPVENPLARVDFFGKPPRVRNLEPDENPLYLARNGVAQMKKTRREKDWAYANLLGHQMLQRGDPGGLLHVMDAERLMKVAHETEVNETLIKERPLLKLALASSPELERYLKAEKEFWYRLDGLRLTAYEKAWQPYGDALNQHPELLTMDFLSQNQAMIRLAEQTLDPAPVKQPEWKVIVGKAKAETAEIFQNLEVTLLPTPSAFNGQEDEMKTSTVDPDL